MPRFPGRRAAIIGALRLLERQPGQIDLALRLQPLGRRGPAGELVVLRLGDGDLRLGGSRGFLDLLDRGLRLGDGALSGGDIGLGLCQFSWRGPSDKLAAGGFRLNHRGLGDLHLALQDAVVQIGQHGAGLDFVAFDHVQGAQRAG